jgi:hypothetical protein
MNRMESVLKEYSAADETERLYLFLSHPDLRGRFLKIDMAEPYRSPVKRSSPKASRRLESR